MRCALEFAVSIYGEKRIAPTESEWRRGMFVGAKTVYSALIFLNHFNAILTPLLMQRNDLDKLCMCDAVLGIWQWKIFLSITEDHADSESAFLNVIYVKWRSF